MRTVADMKRLAAGTYMRQTMQGFKPIDRVQIIKVVNSVGLQMRTMGDPDDKPLGYADFPKAANFRGTEKGYQILCEGRVLAEYEVLDGPPATFALDATPAPVKPAPPAPKRRRKQPALFTGLHLLPGQRDLLPDMDQRS